MALKAVAEEYFRSMNPIAAKIQDDIDDTIASYENIWLTLSEKEKREIINESMIKPEISLTYVALDNLEFDLDDPPVRNDDLLSFFGRQHGSKVIQDENGTYRDEHSAPFIYHTESQLNLCSLKEYRSNRAASPVPAMSELAISHSKVVNELKNALRSDKLKRVFKDNSDSSMETTSQSAGFISKIIGNFKSKDEDLERLVSPEPQGLIAEPDFFKSPNNDKRHNGDYRSSIIKSNSDLSEEQRGLLSSSHTSSRTDFHSMEQLTESTLPKTGYDFLDNW